MTVKELKTALALYDNDTIVMTESLSCIYHIKEVYFEGDIVFIAPILEE